MRRLSFEDQVEQLVALETINVSHNRIDFKSSIGLGGSGLGTLYRDVSDEQAQDTLIAAYDGGMRYFDTAPFYGYGKSELRLGRFLRGVPRDSFCVSTKVGRYLKPPLGEPLDYGAWAKPLHLRPVFDYSYDGTMRAFEQSASRLGFADIDVLYIHDVDRFTHGERYDAMFGQAMEGCYRALDELRSAGHVRGIGVGVNESDAAMRFLAAGTFDVVLIAGRYTLLEQGALDALLPAATARNTAIVAAGIFNSGILAAPAAEAAASTYDYAPAPRDVIEKVERLHAVCAKHGLPVQAVALQFPLCHPAVSAVVVGMSEPQMVRQNLDWASVQIPPSLWVDLKAAGCLAAAAPVPSAGT
jgi:D-threo-aldose 1-dehydrogenase